jgi:hypothetical protein
VARLTPIELLLYLPPQVPFLNVAQEVDRFLDNAITGKD